MKCMGGKSLRTGDSGFWKARRQKAEEMFAAGERQSTVARTLGISRQCVHNWYWQWQGGNAGTQERMRRSGAGRKRKLDAGQLAEVDAALRHGPRHFGFSGERWTLWRVAAVIERITGVRYHPSSIWRILGTLGWSLRPPADKERRPKTVYTPREWTGPSKHQLPSE